MCFSTVAYSVFLPFSSDWLMLLLGFPFCCCSIYFSAREGMTLRVITPCTFNILPKSRVDGWYCAAVCSSVILENTEILSVSQWLPKTVFILPEGLKKTTTTLQRIIMVRVIKVHTHNLFCLSLEVRKFMTQKTKYTWQPSSPVTAA